MKMKRKDEWIRDTFQVLNVYPFVLGALYYVRIHSPTQHSMGQTRFIHALDLNWVDENVRMEELFHRNPSFFFPIEGLFVEDGILYQVFENVEGTLFTQRLYPSVPWSLAESIRLLTSISRPLVKMYAEGQFTVVHPQNIFITDDSVRFLYGGPEGMLPKRKGSQYRSLPLEERLRMNEALDVYSLGLMGYMMLTGTALEPGKVQSMRWYRDDVPSDLEHMVLKSLGEHPLDRPRLSEFVGRLEMFLAEGLRGTGTAPQGKPNEDTVREDPFALLLKNDDLPDSPSAALNPDEWENWVAGPLFPTQECRDPHRSHELPPGNKVWEREEFQEEAATFEVLAPSSDPSVKKKPIFFDFVRKKPALWSVALLLIAGLGASYLLFGTGDEEEAARYYGESVRYMKDENYPSAISKAKLAVETDPSDKQYLLHLADLYHQKQKYNKAVDILEQGVKKVSDPEVYYTLSVNALWSGQLNRAESAIKKAISKDKNNPDYLYQLANIYGEKEDYKAAIQSLESAVDIKPDQASYRDRLAEFLLEENQPEKAMTHAEKAVQLKPNNPAYHMRLGRIYLTQRKRFSDDSKLPSKKKQKMMDQYTKSAVDTFEQATKLYPDSANAYYFLSIAEYYAGDLKQAKKSAKRSLELAPGAASSHYQYGIVLQRMGEKEKARKHYKKALSLDPDNKRYKEAVQQLK
ncbi:tetratricopeptide repeat protein [Melghirimyces algeriensis]|uniref:Tetratricopeptide repeat-containing protein n=1 Tax=Melghirimyces algeriensis TaxID=910412 RepID=A0A521DX47_9BACL|nr:tetratricopeptide repeat protein [Melghirimyces algeriensis]SMO76178.1 Tetratricopeptide repeat-containing protein [Melghirimyces algeriensis]